MDYIYDNLKGDWPVSPVLTEGPCRAPQTVDRFGLGDAQYRRLIRHIEALHDIYRHFAEDLTHALGTVF